MKTNTNTEQVREQVLEYIDRFRRQWVIEGDYYPQDDLADDIVELIDQYVHQKTIEARINELKRGKRDNLFTAQTKPRVERRLDQLQASLNTEGGE